MTAPSVRGKMVNSFDPTTAGHLDDRARTLIERRQRLLGPAYRLFYEKPVEIARGLGTTLWDSDGRQYLDAYNNVVSVGHANPRVVEAVHQQMQTLNTHTRYLNDRILDYSEKLLSTFDGRIASGHTMFTCTGSEANDLALRIAKHHTGEQGVIITAEAYHGNSDLVAGISPSLGEYSALGTHTRQVLSPDAYRYEEAELIEAFTTSVRAQIKDLQRHGSGLAAFISDSLFSSDGIYAHPTGLLAAVAEIVHDAGGVMIADEVQSGFARSGEQFWGYRRHGYEPDIVTMGKPMGNGFPVAAVVVRPEIIESFGRDSRYFNTFGGNTVAAAAASATLDVILDDDLLSHAKRIGTRITDGFTSLAARYESIGDVRGSGLYIGVEMVSDRTTKTPDARAAAAVVNGLRERYVLISATGPAANVLKIRPPLVFTETDADRLLDETERVFRDTFQ